MTPRDALAGARFLAALPRMLRRRIGHDAARAIVAARQARRGADLLTLLHGVYANARHPTRWLLQRAGCALGDAARLIERDGVEDALRTLAAAGVYLSGDEAAGRVPVVRGGEPCPIERPTLTHRRGARHLRGHSSGSGTGLVGTVALDLEAACEQVPNLRLGLDSHGPLTWRLGLWTTPGSTGLISNVQSVIALGRPLDRWFSPVDPCDPALPAAHRWSGRGAAAIGRLAGVRLAVPEHAPPAAPQRVLAWIRAVRDRGHTPRLALHPTSALQLGAAAASAGTDLSGVVLSLRGEPITATRAAAVAATGATVSTLYGAIECGMIGLGCRQPAAADEVHLCDDLVAAIAAGDTISAASGMPPDGLLFTALRPFSRLALVNASLGDAAQIGRRACGCPLAEFGWQTLLWDIHSFEKLTGRGMTFAAAEIHQALDTRLPARFGGHGGDYQLIEEELPGGGIRLRLLVHPRLGPLDATAVTDAFLDALAATSPTRRTMALAWREAGIVQIERRAPLATVNGKILPFRRQH